MLGKPKIQWFKPSFSPSELVNLWVHPYISDTSNFQIGIYTLELLHSCWLLVIDPIDFHWFPLPEEELLGTSRRAFRWNAQALADEIRDSGGAERAVDLIQEVIPRSKRGTLRSKILE